MTKRIVAAQTAVVIIALLALGACELLVPRACTLIGCAPGLTVTLSPVPSGAYSVELIVPGDVTPRVLNCPDPSHCAAGVMVFNNVSAETVTVVVSSGANEFRRVVQPTYTTSRPNGPGCDPVCRQGAVTVVLPVPTASAATP